MSTYQRLLVRDSAPPMPGRTTENGTPSIRWPSERGALGRLACRHCGARVIVADVPTADAQMVDVSCWMCSRVACELVHDSLRRMTPEQFRALPVGQGQRRRPGPKPRADVTCPDCTVAAIRPTTARCRDCETSRRGALALKHRVVSLLETGRPFSIEALMQKFGVTDYAIRHAIANARKDGRRLVNEGGLYRLEAGQR